MVVQTNRNFNQQNKNKTATSLNKPKNAQQETPKLQKTSLKKISDSVETNSKKEIKKPPVVLPKKEKADNPFLVSNPFYLDEEDKQRIEHERKEREAMEKELEREIQMQGQDSKKMTTNSLNRSL
jgi:uncharacterized membrane-anchored protein